MPGWSSARIDQRLFGESTETDIIHLLNLRFMHIFASTMLKLPTKARHLYGNYLDYVDLNNVDDGFRYFGFTQSLVGFHDFPRHFHGFS